MPLWKRQCVEGPNVAVGPGSPGSTSVSKYSCLTPSPDVFTSIWNKISDIVRSNTLLATEEVLFELEKNDDGIFFEWAKNHASMFVPLNDGIQVEVASILNSYPRLVDTRRERSGADPFVLALAKMESLTVITSEKLTGRLDKPNIPDACTALGIRCLHPLEMFRELGWRV